MNGRGITLVELMITVAVASVLMTLALPSFRHLLASQRSTAALNQMIGAVLFARTQAILSRQVVTLCPGDTGTGPAADCLGRQQWHHGALALSDRNGNGRVDAVDHVYRRFPPLRSGERVYWRSFRSRSYLQFHPRGYTRWQNGNFLYCPPDQDATLARMAIINASGRVRLARDRDGDGIVEDARGRDVSCPP